MIVDKRLHYLVEKARKKGASSAVLIPTSEIPVKEALAELCRDPGCGGYGRSASCPPHVGGPEQMRTLLSRYDHALFLKIDVSTEILLSEERLHVFKLLHEIVAAVEQAAIQQGHHGARAFAGGCCRQIFCDDQPSCAVIDDGDTCRHPECSRASMSGYGIHVAGVMKVAGWPMKMVTSNSSSGSDPMSSVAGLILIS